MMLLNSSATGVASSYQNSKNIVGYPIEALGALHTLYFLQDKANLPIGDRFETLVWGIVTYSIVAIQLLITYL